MFKNIIVFILLLSSSIFANENMHSNKKKSISFCIKEDQRIDTSNWITFPIAHEYVEDGSSKEEHIIISFPSEPKYMEGNGVQLSCLTATDEEGMIFSVATMQIPESNFNFQQSIDFLIESISKSPTKKLVAYGPLQNTSELEYSIMWVQNDKMTWLKLVKSAHFIYFLETNVHNEIYRDMDTIKTGTEFDIMMKDSLKTAAFTKSLKID